MPSFLTVLLFCLVNGALFGCSELLRLVFVLRCGRSNSSRPLLVASRRIGALDVLKGFYAGS